MNRRTTQILDQAGLIGSPRDRFIKTATRLPVPIELSERRFPLPGQLPLALAAAGYRETFRPTTGVRSSA